MQETNQVVLLVVVVVLLFGGGFLFVYLRDSPFSIVLQEGLSVCTSFDQTLRVIIVTKLKGQ